MARVEDLRAARQREFNAMYARIEGKKVDELDRLRAAKPPEHLKGPFKEAKKAQTRLRRNAKRREARRNAREAAALLESATASTTDTAKRRSVRGGRPVAERPG